MHPTTTHESPELPPPPPFYFSTDLEDGEVDVELDDDDCGVPGDDDFIRIDTQVEQIEFMGSGYTSLSAYFVRELEDFIDPSVQWILTTMDMAMVQKRFEANRYRYILEGTSVYRVGLRANPKPPPGKDPPGPGMPTRGGT